jgi:hypothetical protein
VPEQRLQLGGEPGDAGNCKVPPWGILRNAYHDDIREHGTVFYACAVITQLSVANGEPLFKVEYSDE